MTFLFPCQPCSSCKTRTDSGAGSLLCCSLHCRYHDTNRAVRDGKDILSCLHDAIVFFRRLHCGIRGRAACVCVSLLSGPGREASERRGKALFPHRLFLRTNGDRHTSTHTSTSTQEREGDNNTSPMQANTSNPDHLFIKTKTALVKHHHRPAGELPVSIFVSNESS